MLKIIIWTIEELGIRARVLIIQTQIRFFRPQMGMLCCCCGPQALYVTFCRVFHAWSGPVISKILLKFRQDLRIYSCFYKLNSLVNYVSILIEINVTVQVIRPTIFSLQPYQLQSSQPIYELDIDYFYNFNIIYSFSMLMYFINIIIYLVK